MQMPTLLHSLGAFLIALSVLAAVQLALLAHSLARFDQDGTFSRGNPGFSRGADFITPLVFAAYTLLLPPWEYYWLLVAKKHNQPLYKRWSVSLTLGFTLAYAIISLWRVQNLPERVGGFLCGRVLGNGSCAELKAIIAFNVLVLVAAIISIGLWSHLHRQDRALWHSGGLQPQFAMPQVHHGHPGDVENAHWQQQQDGGYQPDLSALAPPAYYIQPGGPQAGKQGT